MFRTQDAIKTHIKSLLEFYYPRVMDTENGGYFGGLRDDGSIYDADTRHLVDVCRHIYNFSTASCLFDSAEMKAAAQHGLQFLNETHRLPQGGFAWVVNRRDVVDATRHCYGHAFVLLAASAAVKANIEGASDLVEEIWQVLDDHFYEAGAGLYVDQIGADNWQSVDPYRGQNANMHLCEAMLAAHDATGVTRYLDRAHGLARKICVDLARETEGLIWEHYSSDWNVDWQYNLDDPKNLFRPYGYLPGHFVEWTKLLVLLHKARPEDWMLERARALFDVAVSTCWDDVRGGFHYSFAPGGAILDTDRYYWVVAEAIAASALLADATGDAEYWKWYDKFWQYADHSLIDHKFGGWFRLVDVAGETFDDLKSPPAKTDYHPLSACATVLPLLKRV